MPTAVTKPKPRLVWERIGPAQAIKFLEANTLNRSISEARVAQYSSDMENKRWRRTTTPIKFDTNGTLIDGQHRLWAVINSGQEVEFLVAYDCDVEEREVQDIGKGRTLREIISFEQVDVTAQMIAAANAMQSGVEGTQMGRSFASRREFLFKHWQAILFACSYKGKKMTGIRAAVLGVIARAYYTIDHEMLEIFRDTVAGRDNFDARYSPALRLKDWLLQASRQKRHGGLFAKEVYCKTQRALQLVIKGETVAYLVGYEKELFPIPDDSLPRETSRALKVQIPKKKRKEPRSYTDGS